MKVLYIEWNKLLVVCFESKPLLDESLSAAFKFIIMGKEIKINGISYEEIEAEETNNGNTRYAHHCYAKGGSIEVDADCCVFLGKEDCNIVTKYGYSCINNGTILRKIKHQ